MTITTNSILRRLGPNKTTITANTTITAKEHGAKEVLVLDLAAGLTVTLPAATGSGEKYPFVVATTFTGNGIIQVANSTDVFVGNALFLQDAADTVVGFEAGATDDTITLNGTTTGGLAGTEITVTDIAAGKFAVKVVGAATGTEATPFSAAV